MSEVPLFDSLTHPTLDGSWIRSASRENTLQALQSQMAAHNVSWALAVGMKNIGAYAVDAYANHIRNASAKIFPIAYYDFGEGDDAAEIGRKLDAISRCGYIGIKLHPRFSHIDLASPVLPEVFRQADARKLLVLVCTFLYGAGTAESHLAFGPLLAAIPETCRVILLHGGDVNLLSMMELSRGHPNVLLDLSFTLCRYEGSSVDLDIRYLFRTYDRRVCVGSDSPQYGLGQLRRRFDELSQGVDRERRLNVGYRNLLSFVEGR
jgi:predicted TIM-barrel fold metal-dependent hydrolase